MPRQIITAPNAPGSPLYSQGVKAGPYVLVSGIVGIKPGTGSLAGDTIQRGGGSMIATANLARRARTGLEPATF